MEYKASGNFAPLFNVRRHPDTFLSGWGFFPAFVCENDKSQSLKDADLSCRAPADRHFRYIPSQHGRLLKPQNFPSSSKPLSAIAGPSRYFLLSFQPPEHPPAGSDWFFQTIPFCYTAKTFTLTHRISVKRHVQGLHEKKDLKQLKLPKHPGCSCNVHVRCAVFLVPSSGDEEITELSRFAVLVTLLVLQSFIQQL